MSWICRDYFFLIFSLAAKLIGLQTGCQSFKNVYFFDNPPLKVYSLFLYCSDQYKLQTRVLKGIHFVVTNKENTVTLCFSVISSLRIIGINSVTLEKKKMSHLEL